MTFSPADFTRRFQCPGCVNGPNPSSCPKFATDSNSRACTGHVLGTYQLGIGSFALGLPKGFCRAGFEYTPSDAGRITHRNQLLIRFWPKGTHPEWDHFNVPVWALEGQHSPDPDHHGFLFVRTFGPRTNYSLVDVIEGGTLALCPNALDVSTFFDTMD